MKRRSFFQRVIGGFAAAIGMKLPAEPIYSYTPYQGHKFTLWDGPSDRWMELPSAESRLAGSDWVYDQTLPTVIDTPPATYGNVFDRIKAARASHSG